MSAALLETWSDIVALSETMLRCAENGEWLELADLEAKRRAVIATAVAPADTDRYANAIQRILALDQRTMLLAQAGHATLAKQLQTLNIGRSAIHAYAQAL